MVIKIVFIVLSCAYGTLSIVAALSHFKNSRTNVRLNCLLIMVPGGLLLILSNFDMLFHIGFLYAFVMAGLILLHASAALNGYFMQGKLNMKHHFVRLVLSIVLMVLFILSRH